MIMIKKYNNKYQCIRRGRDEDTATSIYLIVPEVLQDVQPVPCFLTKSYIPPFIASVANLCCNLDESPFISEDGRNSVSNGTAVAISISKP